MITTITTIAITKSNNTKPSFCNKKLSRYNKWIIMIMDWYSRLWELIVMIIWWSIKDNTYINTNNYNSNIQNNRHNSSIQTQTQTIILILTKIFQLNHHHYHISSITITITTIIKTIIDFSLYLLVVMLSIAILIVDMIINAKGLQ